MVIRVRAVFRSHDLLELLATVQIFTGVATLLQWKSGRLIGDHTRPLK